MKKSHGFLHLALACAAFSCSAHAADKYVTPVQEQVIEQYQSPLPDVAKACEKHIKEQNSQSQLAATLANASEGCKKVTLIMNDAIMAAADACISSFDPTVRDVMNKSLNNTFEVQGLQCSISEARTAPCPECNGAIRNILRVVTTMSTKDLDESLGAYSNIIPKLHAAAEQYGCDKFNFDKAQAVIADLAKELKDNAQKSLVAFKAGSLREAPRIQQARLPGPKFVGKYRTELDPIKIAGGSSDASTTSSTAGATSGSDQKGPTPPPGLTAVDLGGGSTGFVYQDPEHKGQSMIGYQVTDPKTNEQKTYAFPISAEDAAKIAKDPTLCAQYIKQAQDAADAKGMTPEDALKNGENLKANLIAQMDAKGKAHDAHADSGQGTRGAQGAQAESAAASADSDSDSDSSIPDQFRVGKGVGYGIGTGLKAGGGVGLRGSKMAVPPKAAKADSSAKSDLSAKTEQSEKSDQAGKNDSAQDRDAEQEYMQELAARSSGSEPNGVEYKPNSASGKGKGKGKADAAKARDPEQEYAAKLASRTSLSEPNGEDYNPEPSQGDAKSHEAKTASASSSSPSSSKASAKKHKPATKKKPAAKKTTASSSSSSSSSSSKHTAKKAEQEKPATYSGITFTPEGPGRVRYFIVNRKPVPFIGRVVEVMDKKQMKPKTQIIYYDLSVDAKQLGEISRDAQKLKETFEQRNRSESRTEPHFMYLSPEVDNHAIEDSLLNQALKR